MLNKLKSFFEHKDLTTDRRPLIDLIYFCIPLLISTLLTNGINLINSVILKETVGGISVTAMNQTGSLQNIIFNFAYGCTSGFAVIIGNKYGAKDDKGLSKTIITTIFLSIALWIVCGVAGILSLDSLLKWLNVPEIYYDKARQFFLIELAFFIVFIISNLGANILRVMGNSFVPLIINIICTGIHTLTVFLLTAPGIGNLDIVGCAMANIITNVLSGGLCFYFVFRSKEIVITKESFKMEGKMIIDMIKMGIPLGFQWTILFFGSFIQNSQMNLYGEAAASAMAVFSSWEGYIVNIPYSITSAALLSFVSQNYGARRYSRIKKGVKDTIIINCIVYGVMLVVGFSTLGNIAYLFLPKEAVNDQIQYYVRTELSILIPFGILQAMLTLSRSTVQGIKRPLIPLISGIGELVARTVVSLYFPLMIDSNYKETLSNSSFVGLCFSTPSAWLISTIVMGSCMVFMVLLNKSYDVDYSRSLGITYSNVAKTEK